MGVKGLYQYMCWNVPDGVVKIDIKEEIDIWKAEHNNQTPTIVIDVKELSHLIVQRDEVGIFCGGRHLQYNRLFRQFLDRLQDTGAQLIFFACGNKLNDHPDIFIPKREKEYIDYMRILEKIDRGVPIRKLLDQKNALNSCKRATLSVEYNVMRMCRRYGKLYYNYFCHNQEMARFAYRHQDEIIAIISNDTDFLIFEGDWQFWLCNDIDMMALTTNRFCRQTLRAHLQLSTEELKLLAALSGTNYLPTKLSILRTFYESLEHACGRFAKIPDLANYIRKLNHSTTTGNDFDFGKIATDVFGANYTSEEENCIKNGISIYNLDFYVSLSGSEFLTQVRYKNCFIYKLLTNEVYNIRDIWFIDYRHEESAAVTYAELVVEIIKKLYGILLKQENKLDLKRKICVKYKDEEPFRVREESPLYPPYSLPKLSDLIFGEYSPNSSLTQLKWSLIFWVLGITDDAQKSALMQLPEKYIVPVLTLICLVQAEQLTVKEADAILISEYDCREIDLMPRRIIYPYRVDGRYVRIAYLYLKIYELICNSLHVCGLFKFADLIKFDGAHFHNYMVSFETSDEMLNSLISQIDGYRLYAA